MNGIRTLRDRRFWMLVLTAVFVVFIFANSLQNGDASSGMSGRVVGLLQELADSLALPWKISEHLVRKTAHFLEYSGLGILLAGTLRAFTARMSPSVFAPLFVGLLVPVADEFLQTFVPGRSGMVRDVALDFSGVLFGFWLTAAVLYGARAWRRAQRVDRTDREERSNEDSAD